MSKEQVMEALRGFQAQSKIYFRDDGKVIRNYTTAAITQLQQTWNRYIRANKAYHDGRYVPHTDPNFLQ